MDGSINLIYRLSHVANQIRGSSALGDSLASEGPQPVMGVRPGVQARLLWFIAVQSIMERRNQG